LEEKANRTIQEENEVHERIHVVVEKQQEYGELIM
jgi:hypothetical protein